MDYFLVLTIFLLWIASVAWAAIAGVVRAWRSNDWSLVAVSALTAATVGGPLLAVMPEHDLPFGGHTKGLGFVLVIVSWAVILLSRPAIQRILDEK